MMILVLLYLLYVVAVTSFIPNKLQSLDSFVIKSVPTAIETKNFISNIIEDDISKNRNGGRVVTRFPPEPNGYLHLGHAKSIILNFGIAKLYNGVTNMRFDDTNPAKEDMEYVNSILDDVRWLTTSDTKANPPPWDGAVRHASDYFDIIYNSAVFLIKNGLAYVDDLTADEMKEYRGTLTEPGKNSPYRDRSIEENLLLFENMKKGVYPDGQCVLRAKIDMTSPNINMRDPTLYRIKRASHPITGDKWLIYPMYDFAHAISDAYEGITHSLCTLEFADHRPLYDWILDKLHTSNLLPFSEKGWRPVQTEFSRLNLQYVVLSKRKLIQLVNEKHVSGWDDPRMPTICGLRRRGYPAEALKLFCDRIGISKAENNIDVAVLEECVREVLDASAARSFCIMNPLKVTITNWDRDDEVIVADNHPKRADLGTRELSFNGNLFIDADDFFDTGVNGELQPPKGYKRLLPGGIVRLKYGYVIQCNSVIRDPVTGQVTELLCTYDVHTKGGVTPEGSKKAKGIIQWVSQKHGVQAELRLFDRLFAVPNPGKEQPDGNFLHDLNKNSVIINKHAVVEPSLLRAPQGSRYQFERVGYFCVDSASNGQSLVFNRIVTLKDTWSS
jgi:glutaminyl-tRNA synthetase